MPSFSFRKSTYSNPEFECLEVATNVPATIAVRDSKATAHGPVLRIAPAAWQAFLSSAAELKPCVRSRE